MSLKAQKCVLCINFVIQSNQIQSKDIGNYVKEHIENYHSTLYQKLNPFTDEAVTFDSELMLKSVFTEVEQKNYEKESIHSKDMAEQKTLTRTHQCEECKQVFTRP